MGDVIPGAARLISETAQRVHTIGQKQKNDQHLRRVQALLSGRQAKGLTSGSLPTSPSNLNCPVFYFYLTLQAPTSCSFLTHPSSGIDPAYNPCFLSFPFLLFPWILKLP